MKKEVFIMHDFKALCRQAHTLVIFKSLHEVPVFEKLLDTLAVCESDSDKAIEKYSDFVAELFAYSDNLTEYMLKLVLENENLFMLKKGEGKETGALLEECLANELAVIEELSQIPCDEIIAKIDYDGFLPRYATQKLDFSQIYADRIHAIGQYGYGIYSQYHVFVIKDGKIVPVEYPDDIKLSDLHNYERERQEVINNTLALLKGKPANNVLLYGDCGTGKSSTVKAIANEYACKGLRLIELKLKAILEGSVSSTADNLCIYATSNRRHLVHETFSSREGDEIHFKDTMQELLSLSDRFGLTVTYQKPDKKIYLDVVEKLAKQYELKTPIDEVLQKAEAYALSRAGRSPRVAKQFVEYMKGMED